MIRLAGLGQVMLALGSLAVPGVLSWRAELIKVQPLIKQMFWVYAAYIFVINLCFALLSIFDSHDLQNGSTIAILITGFISLYWVSRVLIQFFYFDRKNFPAGGWHRAAEVLLVAAFVFFSLVYGWVCCINLQAVK
ncbi:MAG TPA: hypothetical protein VFE53_25315 [Mucilaginibacter sp.]|nr:hypothetical protein [Mucilaginibacter sp.]